MGNEQCCQLPSMSTNFRSIISASCFLASAKKSSGVIEAPPVGCGAASYEAGAWGGKCGENVRRSIADLAEIDGRSGVFSFFEGWKRPSVPRIMQIPHERNITLHFSADGRRRRGAILAQSTDLAA